MNTNSKDIEAELILLIVILKTEIHHLEGWKNILKRVREIKDTNELSSEYEVECEKLITSLIEIIDKMEESKLNNKIYM